MVFGTRRTTVSRATRRGCGALSGVVALVTLGVSAGVTPVGAAASPALGRTTIGRIPVLPARATRLGPAPGHDRLQLDVVLRPRDPAALAAEAVAVSTPGNPRYRHFLPAGQLTRAFGPTAATVTAVRTALAQAGLRPGRLSADGLVIPVSVTVAEAEQALHTKIAAYRLASGRTALSNTTAPSLPSPVAAAVQSVVGLDSAPEAQPQWRRVEPASPVSSRTAATTAAAPTSPAFPCSSATVTAYSFTSYTANQLASAYSFTGLYDDGDFGTGATVALFELEPFEASDIARFQQCYDTDVPVTAIKVDGGAGKGSGSGEAALDIENVAELAPGVSIDVYEAPNTEKGLIDNYSRIASDDSAPVVSTSWGLCEAYDQGSMGAETTLFEEMAAQGQSVFAASGDAGSEDCVARSGYYSMAADTDPVALMADPATATVYVANRGSGDVTVESEADESPVLQVRAGTDPDGLALDPTTHNLYVADGTSPGTVSVMAGSSCDAGDQSDCTVSTVPDVGGAPAGLVVDPSTGTVYVADEGSGTVSVIATSTDTVVGSVALGASSEPTAVALDAADGTLYVTEAATDTVAVVDTTTCNASVTAGCSTATGSVAVGDDPQGVVVDPSSDTVYVANNGDDTVSVIDATTATVVDRASVPLDPVGLSLSPSGQQVLVAGVDRDASGVSGARRGVRAAANRGSIPVVAVLSTDDDTVTTYLTTGTGPTAVAVDPVTGYAFVADGTAGKHGAGDVAILPLFLAVDDPGSQPEVTDVGGTDLVLGTHGTSESAWGDPLDSNLDEPLGAGGGGVSSVFAMPSYQDSVVGPDSSAEPCGAAAGADCREVPDVSASADPNHGYVVYWAGSWTAFGGTSGAAPLWAALAALAVTVNGAVQRLGNLNPVLYQLAADGAPDFTDVTTGDTDYTTTNGGAYAAGAGYDMASGLGSPVASALAVDLDPLVVSQEPADETVVAGQTATFTVAAAGTPDPTIQWQVSSDHGATFTTITGATDDSYSLTASAADDGNEYQALVSNTSGSVTTTAAVLDVFAITTSSLPPATPGSAYQAPLQAVGAPAALRWTETGKLPRRLKLTRAGVLEGTPRSAKSVKPGSYPFTVTATTKATRTAPSLHTSLALVLTLE